MTSIPSLQFAFIDITVKGKQPQHNIGLDRRHPKKGTLIKTKCQAKTNKIGIDFSEWGSYIFISLNSIMNVGDITDNDLNALTLFINIIKVNS